MVRLKLRLFCPQGRGPLPKVRKAVWPPKLVWTLWILTLTGMELQYLCRPAHSWQLRHYADSANMARKSTTTWSCLIITIIFCL
jgi:hypothetical protein